MRAIGNALANLLQNVSNGWAWLADILGEFQFRLFDEIMAMIDRLVSLLPMFFSWLAMAISEVGTKIVLWVISLLPDMPTVPNMDVAGTFVFANRYLPLSEVVGLMTFTVISLGVFLLARMVLWILDFFWIG